MKNTNQKDGGERCHHGFPVDMFEPEPTDEELFDEQLTQWLGWIVVTLAASSFIGLAAGIIYGGWLR